MNKMKAYYFLLERLMAERTLWRFLQCLASDGPWTKMSFIIRTTPSRPSRMLSIVLWKYSGADEIPKGILLKQNLPQMVMKVVRSLDISVFGIWSLPCVSCSISLPTVSATRIQFRRSSHDRSSLAISRDLRLWLQRPLTATTVAMRLW